MKRVVIAIMAAALVAAAAGPAFSQEQIVFKFMGGLAQINGGDYNKGVDGTNRLFRDSFETVSGGFKKLHTGQSFHLEIVNYWGRHFGVGVGGGYYQIDNESGVTVTPFSIDGATITTQFFPKLSVIPFFLNAHYRMNVAPRIALDVFAGPVFQIVQFGFRRTEVSSSSLNPLSVLETFKASGVSLGGQAGLDVNIRITRWLSFVAEGVYRAASISNFSGNWLLQTTTAEGTTTLTNSSFFLWYFEQSERGNVYPQFGFFDANGPSGTGISAARKAEISLSGVMALAGIKLGF